MSAISRLVHKTMLKIDKNAPKILFVAGIAGFGATVVSTARAAVKSQPVIETMKAEAELVVDNTAPHTQNRTEGLVKVYTAYGAELAKIYAPTIVLGVVSVACLTKSHNILTTRNVAITAAFTSLDKTFKEYRARVIQDQGLEKDTEYAHGATKHDVISYDEDGNPVIEEITRASKDVDGIYSFFFDETNRRWIKDPGYNHSYLSNQQKNWNLELKSKGFVFLNDVLKDLGFEPTKAGQLVGWVYDSKDGDGYIDFGFNRYPEFVAGYERSVRLEFNVDGIVIDQI